MLRAKRIAAVLLAAVTLFCNLCVSVGAAANGGLALSLESGALAKPGGEFYYEINVAPEADGIDVSSALIDIALPKIFTVKEVYFGEKRLSEEDNDYFTDKNNHLKILSDIDMSADGGFSWSLSLKTDENAAEGVYAVTVGDKTQICDSDLNRLLGSVKNGYVRVVSSDSFILGDVNSDKNVNSVDLSALRKDLLGVKAGNFDKNAADCHADNRIDILDLIALKKIISEETAGEIYLSDNGSDSADGSSSAPVKTLKTAINLVPDGGTIYITDKLTYGLGAIWPYNSKKITISGGRIDASGAKSLEVNTNVTFRNIEIILGDATIISAGKGKTVSLDNGVTLTGGAKESKPVLLQYADEFLFSENPTLNWSAPQSGNPVSVGIYDEYGRRLFYRDGITETSVKCASGLIHGKNYTVKMRYTDAYGVEKYVSNAGENGKTLRCIAKKGLTDSKNFSFSNSVSLEVLNNYLSRAVTYALSSNDGSFNDEAIRFLLNVGAKYVQRATGEWYPSYEYEKNYPFLKAKLAAAHSVDPDIVFEACIFEVSGSSMNNIPIPAYVFEAFGLTPENRCFNADLTEFADGYGVDYWEKDFNIPDITTTEMQMFVYYRACSYIDMGFEALHLGQVGLTGKNDTNNAVYTRLIGMIRDYAKTHARRGYVLINAHKNDFKAPNGTMLADMIVAPARMHAAKGETKHAVSETNPQRCIIEKGYWGDSVYQSGISGTSPSGWYAEKYPYLVEFDNYSLGETDTTDPNSYVWGKDEITWFIQQPQWYRREFMNYLINTINSYNENGHVSVVGYRGGGYFANDKSVLCENGVNAEEFIKELFLK